MCVRELFERLEGVRAGGNYSKGTPRPSPSPTPVANSGEQAAFTAVVGPMIQRLIVISEAYEFRQLFAARAYSMLTCNRLERCPVTRTKPWKNEAERVGRADRGAGRGEKD